MIYLMVLNYLLHAFFENFLCPCGCLSDLERLCIGTDGEIRSSERDFRTVFGWDRSPCVRAAAQVCRVYSRHSGGGIQKRGDGEEVLQ